MKVNDLGNELFDDIAMFDTWLDAELMSFPRFCLSSLPITGEYWVLSDRVHDWCEMLRTTYLKMRLSREACPDFLTRCATVKYPLAVID